MNNNLHNRLVGNKNIYAIEAYHQPIYMISNKKIHILYQEHKYNEETKSYGLFS